MALKLICVFLCLVLYWPAFGEIYAVGPTQEYTTINDGLDACVDGDTLQIHAGIYSEGNIIIDKSIRVHGKGFPIIDGSFENEVLTVQANNVTIQGLHIRNVGTSYTEDRAGIRIRQSKNFIVKNNFLENTFFGIYLEYVKDGIVTENRVFGQAEKEMSSGNAIHLWRSENVTIENNHVKNHRDGIYFEFVDHSIAHSNVSEDNLRYGLHFMFSNNDDYTHNTFARNGAGVAVMFSGKIKMEENTFSHNWGSSSYGLLLKEITDATIVRNRFSENSIAIFVEGGGRIKYLDNNFLSNGWAFKISGGCTDMLITNNNFIGNTFDISINSSINNNTFEKNYWDAYSGYDLDKNGIGDVPYRPVKLFNYVINRTPEAIVLLRSLFVDMLNFSERVNPLLTPKNVMDLSPLMQKII